MHHQTEPTNAAIGDDQLLGYLAENLSAEEMARVEKALRASAELRERLERARADRGDLGLHTLGAIWKRRRLTCPSRQELGGFLLDAIDPCLSEYITFHLDTIECSFCRANLADLKDKSDRRETDAEHRRKRIFHSSRGLLGDEKPV